MLPSEPVSVANADTTLCKIVRVSATICPKPAAPVCVPDSEDKVAKPLNRSRIYDPVVVLPADTAMVFALASNPI